MYLLFTDLAISLDITTVYLFVSVCSDTEEDLVKATTSTRSGTKSTRPRKASVDRASYDTRGSTAKTDITTSEAEDGCCVGEGRIATPADGGPKHTKMAERFEEEVKITDRSSTASKGKKVTKKKMNKTTKSQDRKKAVRERDQSHQKLALSSRKKHLKLKARKAMSKARLKSYGISV